MRTTDVFARRVRAGRESRAPLGTARRRPRAGRLVLAAAAVLAVVIGVGFRRQLFFGNFGVVDPGRVFRSAQPQEPNFSKLLKDREIRSVLNLRGGSSDDPWYADEVRVTREQGVDFYDTVMSATRRPRREELLALVDVFEKCRYPLLIHCKSGSDRTGLASAIYLMVRRGAGPAEARGAFTLGHGHFGLLGTERLHEPIDEYQAWLAAGGLAHTPERFRRWVKDGYASEPSSLPFRPVRPGPRVRSSASRGSGARAGRRRPATVQPA